MFSREYFFSGNLPQDLIPMSPISSNLVSKYQIKEHRRSQLEQEEEEEVSATAGDDIMMDLKKCGGSEGSRQQPPASPPSSAAEAGNNNHEDPKATPELQHDQSSETNGQNGKNVEVHFQHNPYNSFQIFPPSNKLLMSKIISIFLKTI